MGFTREIGLEKKLPGRFDVADMTGGKQEMMVPSRFGSRFQVEGRTSEVEKLLEVAGTNDIHEITQQAYETLAAYYQFYKEKLETSRKQVEK
jgi:hypothetical protein